MSPDALILYRIVNIMDLITFSVEVSLRQCNDAFRHAFRFSEDTFLNIFADLKLKHSLVRKLYETMIQELRNSMNSDLEYLLEDGSLQNAMTKIARLSEEAVLLDAEEAWSVTSLTY